MALNVGMVITGNTSDAQREISQLTDKMRKFGTTTDTAGAEASRSFKQLKASIDPVYRAGLQLKEQQLQLNQAVRAGVVTQMEASRINSQMVAKNRALAASLDMVARSSRRGALQLQNASFQVGDFATQVGAGTAASVALGQQLPQLLGGFGILGAVLGAVAAIAVPLSRALFSSADAAEANIDPIEALAEAQDTARTSLQAYRQLVVASSEDIQREYGGMTQQVRDHITALEDLRKEQAFTAIIDVLDRTFNNDALDALNQAVIDREESLTALQEELAFELQMQGKGLVDNARIIQSLRDDIASMLAFEGISLDFGIPPETIDSFLALREAIEAAVAAGDFQEAQVQVGELRSLLQEVPDGPLKDMIEGVLKAEDLLIRAGFAAGTIAPGVDAAAESASVLTLNLRNAYDIASQLSSLQSDLVRRETDAALRAQFADDPVALAAAQAGAKFDRQNPVGRGLSTDQLAARSDLRNRELALARQEAARRLADRGSRSVGGGSRAIQSESVAIQKLIDGLKQEIELLGELDPVEQEMIKLRGQLEGATEAETEAVRALIETRNEEREALAQHITQLDSWREGARSIFDMIVEGARQGTSAVDILLNVLFDLGSKLTSMAGDSLIDALFGSSGSAGGGAIGGGLADLFGSIFKFAEGDVFDSPTLFGFGNGQLGVMGEAGKEGVVPLEHSFGEGIGVKIGSNETALPLTRLNSGKLGAVLQPFANGGAFGSVTPKITTSVQSGGFSAAPATTGGGVVNNYWSIETPSPRAFAESRATVARNANRLMGSLGRHS